MNEIVLTGLDGHNPLGFLAALGLLRVLDEDAETRGAAPPRLQFATRGEAVPLLRTDLDLDGVIDFVLRDAAAQADNPALRIAYTKDGRVAAPDDDAAVRDLKPPPAIARSTLQECAHRGGRAASLCVAWFSELVQDNNGNTKPTALHFTAGQQAFLSMVEQLRAGITGDDVREALLGPWTGESTLPSLSWDASAGRSYALRASDPSKDKRGSVPAANWLGAMALELFPVAARGDRLMTTGVRGGWKDSTFCWPLWEIPSTLPPIASLLRLDLRSLSSRERQALGVHRVLGSAILRSEQGGYGSFSPAEVVLPSPDGR